MDKKALSERDICTKFIAPALAQAGWAIQRQVREEVTFTKGRVIVRGKLHTRGKARRADFVLYHAPNRPIAVIEAKDNSHDPGDGMQQAMDYADALDVPFAFTSNGDGFVFHDRTVDGATPGATVETHLTLDQFPAPADLWARYCAWRGLDATSTPKAEAPYYDDGSGRAPRYYQIKTYTYPQPVSSRLASTPGSKFGRHGGSDLDRRRQSTRSWPRRWWSRPWPERSSNRPPRGDIPGRPTWQQTTNAS